MDFGWFNFSSPYLSFSLHGKFWRRTRLYGKHFFFRPWNLFRRCCVSGHYWGVGLLQLSGKRSLFYVGKDGPGGHHLSFLFMKTRW